MEGYCESKASSLSRVSSLSVSSLSRVSSLEDRLKWVNLFVLIVLKEMVRELVTDSTFSTSAGLNKKERRDWSVVWLLEKWFDWLF